MSEKEINSPKDHEEKLGQTLVTQDHNVIKSWAEKRKAVPSVVETTDDKDNKSVGVLRLDFPGYGGQRLKEITWEEWFEAFDKNKLKFIYQEHKSDSSDSNFFKLVSSDSNS